MTTDQESGLSTPEAATAGDGPSGWVAVAGQIVGNLDDHFTMWTWNGGYCTTRKAAATLGFSYFGSDDFNIGHVRDGELVWFGWMDEQFKSREDYVDVAERFLWSVPSVIFIDAPLAGWEAHNMTTNDASKKPLASVRAHVGEARGYRSVFGDVERLDAVCLYASCQWLKSNPIAEARLTSLQARALAIDLLRAAEDLDERDSGVRS